MAVYSTSIIIKRCNILQVEYMRSGGAVFGDGGIRQGLRGLKGIKHIYNINVERGIYNNIGGYIEHYKKGA